MESTFRSKLEKRWAEVFKELGIKHEYETQEFEVNVHLQKRKYIPDFYLPEQDLIIEVKAPHKWEGRGLEKSRALVKQGRKIIVCKDNGKFFYLGENVKKGILWKCRTCKKSFFSEDAFHERCIFCESEEIEVYTNGEDGIPHWFNYEQEKWLFDESEYQKMFNVAADKNMDKLENIHNHLQGIPEILSFNYENIRLIKELFDKYPNMEEVKKYIYSFIETADFRNDNRISFQPILLVGSPGCGKTSFATDFAKIVMERNPTKLEMGNGIPFFDIVGSSPDYTNATCGKIIKSMFSESPKPPVQNPVIVIDEFEKIKTFDHSCENVFYTLFEKNSSEIFTDCFFGIPIDASKINYIATANSIDGISKPILNRMKVITIRDNTELEVKDIIIPNIYKDWIKKENIKKNRIPKELSDEIKNEIYERSKGELRAIYAILTELLLEYRHFDEELQEYISLFTKKELKDWQSLTDIVDFESEEWKMEEKFLHSDFELEKFLDDYPDDNIKMPIIF